VNWFIKINSATHDQAGRRRRFSRTFKGAGIPEGFRVAPWLAANLPALFRGCKVDVTTPIHHDQWIVEPDYPHECKNILN